MTGHAPVTLAAARPASGPPGLDDEEACVRLAANPDTHPDTLSALARDDRVTVRAAVALNPTTPDGIDAALADDGDARVRQLLGHKLATLIPGLSDAGQAELRRQALQTLERLVADEAERVRRAIAEIVKDMPQAPRALILRLARDTAVPVSGPVLRLSPVLTSADLLALLASPPSPATATAIAAREGLPAEVAGAIAASEDSEAIRVLLENGSAQLREAALDTLIARAGEQESWHEPMVHRPRLSGRAATALADIVTMHLLAVLAARPDLPPDITAELAQRLTLATTGAGPQRRNEAAIEDALAQAQRLHATGKLDESAIRGAAMRGNVRLCAAMLAVAAGLPLAVVDRAASLRSAKGVVSLTWQAGMSMDLAVTLQSLVGRVAPAALLRGLNGHEFPLTVDEMRWQLDLLRQAGR